MITGRSTLGAYESMLDSVQVIQTCPVLGPVEGDSIPYRSDPYMPFALLLP